MREESLSKARRIAEHVRYEAESQMPVSFDRGEEPFFGRQRVKPYYLLLMLLYAMFCVVMELASSQQETRQLTNHLLEQLVREEYYKSSGVPRRG